jgi:putative flavoprotein involved in K+ transport
MTDTLTRARRVERYDVVVIGGGQAGLAAGYWLLKHDIDFIILDAHPRVGDSWRNRWTSLRLFTPARYSGLPGLPFPADPYHLPGREEVASYLEWYATAFELPVRSGVRVQAVRRTGATHEIETGDRVYQAGNVIVATGPFQTPRVPAFSREMAPHIVQLHSSEYREPSQLPDGDALLVGAANSGAQIALELAQSKRVTLAGRSVGSLPRRLLGRDIFDWLALTQMRLDADSRRGRRLRRNVLGSSDALIGMTESDLLRRGVARGGRVTGARDGLPTLEDGRSLDPASIIWCTGFRPDFSWIHAPVFGGDGQPIHRRGTTSEAGLYFVGLRFQHRLNSSLIGGAGADAKFVVEAIARRYGESRTLLDGTATRGRFSLFAQSRTPSSL